jgi:hypothetical protein
MNTDKAIKLAGGRDKLAELLGVASISTYRWKPRLPKMRAFQLRALKPEWFKAKGL